MLSKLDSSSKNIRPYSEDIEAISLIYDVRYTFTHLSARFLYLHTADGDPSTWSAPNPL